MNVEKKFKAIVADIFKLELDKVRDDTRFIDDLNAKSIDVIALIAATEGEFGIKVPPADAKENETVGQTIKYIENKLESK